MKIDYTIIASDDNTMYYDFLHLITKAWNDVINYKVFFIHICDEDGDIEETEYGICKKIKKIDGINSGFMAQNSRFLAYKFLPDKNLLCSDIDMLPISKKYFNNLVEDIPDDYMLFQRINGYQNYPMCYFASKGDNIINLLEIEEPNVFFKKMWNFENGSWFTDEHYLKNKIDTKKPNKIIFKNRNFMEKRIDRGNWFYKEIIPNIADLYIDSHLPRPYFDHKQSIDLLLHNIKNI
jgi:hypothetical protein